MNYEVNPNENQHQNPGVHELVFPRDRMNFFLLTLIFAFPCLPSVASVINLCKLAYQPSPRLSIPNTDLNARHALCFSHVNRECIWVWSACTDLCAKMHRGLYMHAELQMYRYLHWWANEANMLEFTLSMLTFAFMRICAKHMTQKGFHKFILAQILLMLTELLKKTCSFHLKLDKTIATNQIFQSFSLAPLSFIYSQVLTWLFIEQTTYQRIIFIKRQNHESLKHRNST